MTQQLLTTNQFNVAKLLMFDPQPKSKIEQFRLNKLKEAQDKEFKKLNYKCLQILWKLYTTNPEVIINKYGKTNPDLIEKFEHYKNECIASIEKDIKKKIKNKKRNKSRRLRRKNKQN
jgi:hypothetical protein